MTTPCDRFEPHQWQKNKCRNCFFPKDDHSNVVEPVQPAPPQPVVRPRSSTSVVPTRQPTASSAPSRPASFRIAPTAREPPKISPSPPNQSPSGSPSSEDSPSPRDASPPEASVRRNLMASIRQGAPLRPRTSSDGGERSDLLSSIRQGVSLRPTSSESSTAASSRDVEASVDLNTALKWKLARRNQQMVQQAGTQLEDRADEIDAVAAQIERIMEGGSSFDAAKECVAQACTIEHELNVQREQLARLTHWPADRIEHISRTVTGLQSVMNGLVFVENYLRERGEKHAGISQQYALVDPRDVSTHTKAVLRGLATLARTPAAIQMFPADTGSVLSRIAADLSALFSLVRGKGEHMYDQARQACSLPPMRGGASTSPSTPSHLLPPSQLVKFGTKDHAIKTFKSLRCFTSLCREAEIALQNLPPDLLRSQVIANAFAVPSTHANLHSLLASIAEGDLHQQLEAAGEGCTALQVKFPDAVEISERMGKWDKEESVTLSKPSVSGRVRSSTSLGTYSSPEPSSPTLTLSISSPSTSRDRLLQIAKGKLPLDVTAVREAAVDNTEALVEAIGVAIESKNVKAFSCLFEALSASHPLLDQVKSEWLLNSFSKGQLAISQTLLDSPPLTPAILNTRSSTDGSTCLHHACKAFVSSTGKQGTDSAKGSLGMVRRLVELGADPTLINASGKTPLQLLTLASPSPKQSSLPPDYSAVFGKYLFSPSLSDVTIKCPVGPSSSFSVPPCSSHRPVEHEGFVHFPAHKVVLCSQSPVFEAMLDSQRGWSDSSSKEVLIDDVQPNTLALVLEYLYTGTVTMVRLDLNSEVSLLGAASKLMVKGLKETCEHALARRMSTDNVADLLRIAFALDASLFVTKAIEFILNHFQDLPSLSPSSGESKSSVLVFILEHLEHLR